MIKEKILNNLKDIVIIQDSDGSYKLFNRYCITKTTDEFTVTVNTSYTTHSFSTLRNATIWCVADKRNQIYAANRIRDLDRKLGSLDADINVYSNLIKRNKKIDDKLIFLTKLDEARSRKNDLTAELNGYVISSKIWQTKQFQKPNILH